MEGFVTYYGQSNVFTVTRVETVVYASGLRFLSCRPESEYGVCKTLFLKHSSDEIVKGYLIKTFVVNDLRDDVVRLVVELLDHFR
jgi:hypothetical protein